MSLQYFDTLKTVGASPASKFFFPLELTKLYAKRARGEPVDAAMLQAAGRAALRVIVPKQVDAGIDIGNNGEQQRDSFIFYIRDLHRSGSYPEARAHARVSALVLTEARDMLSSRPREAQR